ncbi:MAG: Smr/MutS family protein, partial [Sphaerochaetaceae bacterium]|nr:Smr/MutS family protein [Sphaerochaetaceae bacterium]
AKQYLGSDSLQMSEIIKSLERKREEARERLAKIEEMEAKLRVEQKKADLYELKLKQQEFILKKNQSTDLSRFVEQTRSELEKLVADLVTGELTKEKKKSVKKFIDSVGSQEAKLISTVKKEEEEIATKDKDPFVLKEGMDVLCGKNRREGTVLKKDGNRKWKVQVGSMKITFKEADLYPCENVKKAETHKVAVSYHNDSPRPKTVIDVRGFTLEEALNVVSTQIEACVVHDFSNFSIIHGLGDGILQRGIQEYLKTQNVVKDYRFAMPNDGGMGKTYVVL